MLSSNMGFTLPTRTLLVTIKAWDVGLLVGDPEDLESHGLPVVRTLDRVEEERPVVLIALVDDPPEPGMVAKSLWNLDDKGAFSMNALKNGLFDQ